MAFIGFQPQSFSVATSELVRGGMCLHYLCELLSDH